jgi:hypothetical protein
MNAVSDEPIRCQGDTERRIFCAAAEMQLALRNIRADL